MKTFSLVVSLAVLAGCTSSTTVTSPVPAKGKPTAPVAVTAELSSGSGRITVAFESDAEDVKIALGGVDGLVVSSPAVVVDGGKFARGDRKTFDVAFTAGEGRSQLVVSVSGTFGGSSRARVAAFAVGSGPLPDTGTVQTTSDGEKVKVIP